jgi:aryl-alcohol dehydrogenase-like predicted oxidoreductase
VTYNLFNPRVSEVLFSAAQEAGCAIIAREVLANGFLTGKYDENVQFEKGDFRSHWRRDYIAARAQAAQSLLFLVKPGKCTLAQASIRFAFSNPAVAVALTGIKMVEQAEENLGASEVPPLELSDEAEIKRLQANDFDI